MFATPRNAQELFLAFHIGITPGSAWGTIWLPGSHCLQGLICCTIALDLEASVQCCLQSAGEVRIEPHIPITNGSFSAKQLDSDSWKNDKALQLSSRYILPAIKIQRETHPNFSLKCTYSLYSYTGCLEKRKCPLETVQCWALNLEFMLARPLL